MNRTILEDFAPLERSNPRGSALKHQAKILNEETNEEDKRLVVESCAVGPA
jgi:hypothetical protein